MIIRSRAPLRLGLAGGGTDVSPYSDVYGGCILNVTIDQYAYASIQPTRDNSIIINSIETGKKIKYKSSTQIPTNDLLSISCSVYNRIIKDYHLKPLSYKLTTFIDAPPGSGLGSSSTLTVSIIAAFSEWLKLPLGKYDIARMAYEIERIELNYQGGKQDQYAATFGGFNFMEFSQDDSVIINPLRIDEKYINELESNLILYYTGISRSSSTIIKEQQKNVNMQMESSIEAMHKLKEQTIMMKQALLKGNINKIGEILNYGWNYKKQMSSAISNPIIDEIYNVAKKAGASGGKITGAGGGGYFMLYCPYNTKYKVIATLKKKFGGDFKKYSFTQTGVCSWQI